VAAPDQGARASRIYVVAPDMRRFGRTSAPADISAYSIFDTVGDMVALVAALGERNALIIGHDWGAPVAWHAALFRPDLFTAVAGLSVPPSFRGRARPLDSLRTSGISNFYWQYFQTPGHRRSRVRARFRLDHENPARPRIFGRPKLPVHRTRQGFPRRRHARATAAGLAQRSRSRHFHRGLPKSPASVAGSTGTATSTATGN
jgi:pimeloyl-ACP methyl ester carboxylesterase